MLTSQETEVENVTYPLIVLLVHWMWRLEEVMHKINELNCKLKL